MHKLENPLDYVGEPLAGTFSRPRSKKTRKNTGEPRHLWWQLHEYCGELCGEIVPPSLQTSTSIQLATLKKRSGGGAAAASYLFSVLIKYRE